MRFLLGVAIFGSLFLAAPQGASAGTLDRVVEAKSFVIGYRQDAKPFSYLDPDGQAQGYSVDLCRHIAAAVAAELDLSDMEIVYEAVPVDQRLEKLARGDIDIECGSTTRTLERQAEVDFTLLIFATGAEFLLPASSTASGISDLAGKRIGVLAGTTTEELLHREITRASVTATVVPLKLHEEGLASLEVGEVDAYFADRVLLIGLAGDRLRSGAMHLSGQFYSFEPYALMVRRGDDDLRLIADRTLAKVYRSGEIRALYQKHFPGARPSGLLQALYILQAIPER